MTDEKKPVIEFAPGCFDNFEGTQEELDALMKEIQDMFESGEAFEKAIPLTDLSDEELKELLDEVSEEVGVEELSYDFMPQVPSKRTLH